MIFHSNIWQHCFASTDRQQSKKERADSLLPRRPHSLDKRNDHHETVSNAIKAVAIIIAQILTTADLTNVVLFQQTCDCVCRICFSVIWINSLFVLKPSSVPFRISYSALGTFLVEMFYGYLSHPTRILLTCVLV